MSFSRFAPRVRLTEERTVSIPALTASIGHIPGCIYIKSIVAKATRHGVVAGFTIQYVVSGSTIEDIVGRIAVDGIIPTASNGILNDSSIRYPDIIDLREMIAGNRVINIDWIA